MKFFTILTLTLVWPFLIIHAQISRGGQPAVVLEKKTAALEQDIIYMPAFQNPSAEALQAQMDTLNNKTLRFAHPFSVALNLNNSGTWYSTADGRRIWRLEIVSEGAKSINLVFSKYKLPTGGMLFVYNSDQSFVRGGFSDLNNKKSGILPVMPVAGDHIIVEYQEPLNAEFDAELEIGTVNHDYIGVINPKVGYFGDSDECEVDVACDESASIYERAIVKLIINGQYLGSGALINTTARDGRPYVLSAHHNFVDVDNVADATLFVFNYKTPFCSTPDIEGTREQSVAGGTMLAISEDEDEKDIDLALMELSVNPPIEYQPVYLGWNSNSSLPSNSRAIHHPIGDVKKISVDDNSPLIYSLTIPDYRVYYENAHFGILKWDSGVTESGSSGCPLLNEDYQIIGALTGGAATCESPRYDYFYRLSVAWDAYEESNRQLKVWLDPENTGERSIEFYISDSVLNLQYLSHVTEETDVETGAISGGYAGGHSSLGYTQFAEKFSVSGSVDLKGVYFVPVKGRNVGSKLQLKVWDSSNGLPSDELYSKDVYLYEWSRAQSFTEEEYGSTGGYGTKYSYAGKQNFVTIDDDSLILDSDFFIGFEVSYPVSSTDTFALYTGLNTSNINTAYYFDGSNWDALSNLSGYGKNASFWIDALAYTKNNVSTDSQRITNQEISIYPNPGNADAIRIGFNTALKEALNVKMTDLSGKIVYQSSISAGTIEYSPDLGGVSAGMYLFMFSSEETSVTRKVVIRR